MYDDLIKRLRNCATQANPCKTCDMVEDRFCSDTMMKFAADAIEELSRKYTEERNVAVELTGELASKPRWISVVERLPIKDGFTLILTENGHPGVSYFTCGWWGGYYRDGITHWMPLPEPPEEET